MMSVQQIVEFLTEETIKEEILDEAARSVGDALNEGYALLIKDGGATKFIVLYEPNEFISLMNEQESIEPEYVVVGYIAITSSYEKLCGGWVVSSIAARQGYGPLMYDIAMSVISPQLLTADRENVSKQARKVWNYMLTVRANDYMIKPVSSKGACLHDVQPNDKALNYMFAIKNKIDFGKLVLNNKQTMRKLSEPKLAEEELVELAMKYFEGRYFS